MKKMKVVFATIALVGALAFTSCANPSGGGSSSKSSNSNSVTNTESSSGSDDSSNSDSSSNGGSSSSGGKEETKTEGDGSGTGENGETKPNGDGSGGDGETSTPEQKPVVPDITIKDFCGDWTYNEGNNIINISISERQMIFTTNMMTGTGTVSLENNILQTNFNGRPATAELDENKENLTVTSDFFNQPYQKNVITMKRGKGAIFTIILEPGIYTGQNGEYIELRNDYSGVYKGTGSFKNFIYEKESGVFVMQDEVREKILVEQNMPEVMSFRFRGNIFNKLEKITYTDNRDINNIITVKINGNKGMFEINNQTVPFELEGSNILVWIKENESPIKKQIGTVWQNDGKTFGTNIDRNNFEMVFMMQYGKPYVGTDGQIKVETVELPPQIIASSIPPMY